MTGGRYGTGLTGPPSATVDPDAEDLRDRLEDAMRAAGCARYRVARDHPFTSRRVATLRPRR